MDFSEQTIGVLEGTGQDDTDDQAFPDERVECGNPDPFYANYPSFPRVAKVGVVGVPVSKPTRSADEQPQIGLKLKSADDINALWDWFQQGQRFFTRDELLPLHELVVAKLWAERAAALREVEELNARLRSLETAPERRGHRPAKAVVLVDEPALPDRVRAVVRDMPGADFHEIAEAVRRISTRKVLTATLHTVLYRLTNGPDAPVVKTGGRGAFRYYLREALTGEVTP